MAARAVGGEYALALMIQNRLSHDGARGVAGAKKKDVVVWELSSCPRFGWCTASRRAARGFGFVARMNALRNLPST